MRGILQFLFSERFDTYRRSHGLSVDQCRAVRNIRTCRTAAQGSHQRICPQGDYAEHHYNSCKHRCCPRCGGFESARWADRQQAKALPCCYYHIVFTVPQELNLLWRFNRKPFTDHFFAAAWDALAALFRDPQWVGGRPGALAVFQSWGETLNVHPHLHVLITAGGLDNHGQWQPARRDFLMPTAALSDSFRGRFLTALRQSMLRDHHLTPPPGQTPDHWAAHFNRLALKHWHVQIQPPYAHPNGLLRYLAFYLRGGPISEHRLHLASHQRAIHLDYKRPDEHRTRHCTLPISEFFSRFLAHVPPRGMRMARSFGLFHPRARKAYQQAQAALLARPTLHVAETAPLRRAAASYPLRPCCPRCGANLIVRRIARAPPTQQAA